MKAVVSGTSQGAIVSPQIPLGFSHVNSRIGMSLHNHLCSICFQRTFGKPNFGIFSCVQSLHDQDCAVMLLTAAKRFEVFSQACLELFIRSSLFSGFHSWAPSGRMRNGIILRMWRCWRCKAPITRHPRTVFTRRETRPPTQYRKFVCYTEFILT